MSDLLRSITTVLWKDEVEEEPSSSCSIRIRRGTDCQGQQRLAGGPLTPRLVGDDQIAKEVSDERRKAT